jgi:hypothetical protein
MCPSCTKQKTTIMKKLVLAIIIQAVSLPWTVGQEIIDAWKMNTSGEMGSFWNPIDNGPGTDVTEWEYTEMEEEANILDVCSDGDYIYVESHGITTNMGTYTNPGEITAQDFVFKFPLNPIEAEEGNRTEVPVENTVAVLINGVVIFGTSDSKSWNSMQGTSSAMGDGVWNGEALYSEGSTLDTAFGAHRQQQGVYHTHGSPFRLYDFDDTEHSPIIGFAFDGFPIYGPFGYTDPLDINSAIKRMETSYELRDISERHRLPDETSDLSENEWGPDVTDDYPLGFFIEDYEYTASGDLNEFNGRFCYTPEYPEGTFAYFVTVDESNTAQYPYFVGVEYYGEVSHSDWTDATIPASSDCDLVTTSVKPESEVLNVYPNPTSDFISLDASGQLNILNALGQLVYSAEIVSNELVDLSNLDSGTYLFQVTNDQKIYASHVVVE